MEDLEQESKQAQERARFLRPASSGKSPGVTVRRYEGAVATRTQETGNAAAPYVGILSYTEEVYVCRGPDASDCELVESSPVTEIFPFSDGRWQY